MIVVRVELWSAITGKRTELARMHISNTGESAGRIRHYTGETFIGRHSAALDKGRLSKSGDVRNYPALSLHIWNLVARMLTSMGYTK